MDPGRLVFPDETWASTDVTRARGSSPSGTRLAMAVPRGRYKTTTFMAALRREELTAPTVVDGAINGDVVVAVFRQQLVPTPRPGDVVVMGNLSSHKRRGPRGDRGERGASGVPAGMQPRLQPDRDGVRQAQGPAAQGRRADGRGAAVAPGPGAGRLPASGCGRISRALRIPCDTLEEIALRDCPRSP